MKFTFYHNNINVANLEKSVEFYQKALGLTITKEKESEDGSFKLVFLGDGVTSHLLELTWLRAASAMTIKLWACTLSPTRTDTGRKYAANCEISNRLMSDNHGFFEKEILTVNTKTV